MTDTALPVAGGRAARWPVPLAALALVLITALGVAGVFRYVAAERERDLRSWQVRMGIVADSRFAAVNDWIEQRFGVLSELAQNASLQLYLTQLELAGGAEAAGDMAEAGYLRNLLVATADSGGFSAPVHGPQVNANVARVGVAGIALVDAQGRVMVATPDMPPVDARLAELVQKNRGRRFVDDLSPGPDGAPTMTFVVPVFAVQSNDEAADQVGAVIGVTLADDLYPRLKQPGETAASAEAVLLRETGNTIDYLSPLADGTAPLALRLARDTPDLAAAFALANPGGFAVRHDYANAEVLVTARRFASVPWTLMYKVATNEALAETDARLGRMLTILLLLVAAVAAALFAAWRHGTSQRARSAAEEARRMAERFHEQRDLLRLVADSQPGAMAIVDRDGRYLWANRKVWEAAGLDEESIVGKPLAAVVGPVPAKALLEAVREALASGRVVTRTHSEERDGETRTALSQFIPLPATPENPARVLIASEDVTELLAERAKRERIMRQLVSTLVGVVDRRDPYSANHSAWVARVARAIAEELDLPAREVDCVETAGRLMNLGKILVPEEILTKAGALDADEIALVRDSLRAGVDLIAGVEFDGPVVETLRELYDHDPEQAETEAGSTLLTTRIIAVANTLVALVSPRSYRKGLSIDEALDTLIARMGAGANRRAVLALANYLDNRGGRAALAELVETAAEPA